MKTDYQSSLDTGAHEEDVQLVSVLSSTIQAAVQ